MKKKVMRRDPFGGGTHFLLDISPTESRGTVQGPLPCGMHYGSRARLAGRQGSAGDAAMETHQLSGLQKGKDCLVEGSWLTWGACCLLKFRESRVDEIREESEITTH